MNRRAELKQKAKEVRPTMGVLLVRNTKNGKVFLESSQDVLARINRHRFELSLGSHYNKNLQADWKLFGADAFTFELLDELPYIKERPANFDYGEELEELERMWLEKLQPFGERGYNLQKPSVS